MYGRLEYGNDGELLRWCWGGEIEICDGLMKLFEVLVKCWKVEVEVLNLVVFGWVSDSAAVDGSCCEGFETKQQLVQAAT